MKRLIELENNTRIGVGHLGLVYSGSEQKVKEINFHHIDGFYSYCTDDNGIVIHLRSTCEVEDLGPIKKEYHEEG